MNLQNHFLIAMPSLDDSTFERAVVYICEHNSKGAMGLIINHPIPDLSIQTLLNKLHITLPKHVSARRKITLSSSVLTGGPLADERGFILHSPQSGFSSSLSISPDVMITTSKDILDSIGTEHQPENVLVTLGYSSWRASQLENEIIENSWQVVDASPEILFHLPAEQRWQAAANKLGVDIHLIVKQVGHA